MRERIFSRWSVSWSPLTLMRQDGWLMRPPSPLQGHNIARRRTLRLLFAQAMLNKTPFSRPALSPDAEPSTAGAMQVVRPGPGDNKWPPSIADTTEMPEAKKAASRSRRTSRELLAALLVGGTRG